MRPYRSLALFAVLAGPVVLSSCGEKNAQNISGPTAGSAVKFFNFGVNAPAVNFYANDKKLSAASTTACSDAVTGATTDATCLSTGKESTSGTAYGLSANGSGIGLYSSIDPGTYTLSGRITATTDNGVAISSTPAAFENGKFYSYYLSGIYSTSTKTVEGFVVEDPLPAFDYSNAYVRFVNAVSNAQPMSLVITSQTVTGAAEVPVGTTVAYKAAGTFVKVGPDIYTVVTRYAGSGSNVITRKDVSFSAGRVYTVTAYGDITATTGASKPALDNTANR